MTSPEDLEVEAHELVWPEPERELAMLERLLAKAPSRVGRKPTNLGAAFDRSCKVLGFRVSLGHGPREITQALRAVVELGVALFHRGGFRPDETVSITLRGQLVQVAGGVTYYTSAPRWAKAVGAAMVVRDQPALRSLCSFDAGDFEGEYDGYHDHFARAVMASVRGEDPAELVAQAEAAARAAQVFPDRAERLGLPLLAVARAVLLGETEGYDERLADALRGYQGVHTQAPDNASPADVVPLECLGLVARAHDDGLPCRVTSGYLPRWLVEGELAVAGEGR